MQLHEGINSLISSSYLCEVNGFLVHLPAIYDINDKCLIFNNVHIYMYEWIIKIKNELNFVTHACTLLYKIA